MQPAAQRAPCVATSESDAGTRARAETPQGAGKEMEMQQGQLLLSRLQDGMGF